MKKIHIILFGFLLPALHTTAQIKYPYPVHQFDLRIEGMNVSMAYMDILPADSTSTNTILLLHGKNFNGYYWKELIPYLPAAGYRVIIPDQLGWGLSDRPNIHYSFQLLANNTKLLLDKLGIQKTVVLAHSMGGMLGTRFTLMFPNAVKKLILENPIGLEDYKTFIPYQPIDSIYNKDKSATYESYKKYQQSYYPTWKTEYDQYVQAQAADLTRKDFDSIAFVNAITYQMIYEQPVCYEFSKIKVPTLLVIGQADRTVVGKDKLSEADKKNYGNYPVLGEITQQKIKGSVLIPLDGIGHIPHVQDTKLFWGAIANWLK